MNKKLVNKNISLSYELSKYLVDHPSVVSQYPQESFVVFVKNNQVFNVSSEKLLEDLRTKGEKKVVKAVRQVTSQNHWKFEIVTL